MTTVLAILTGLSNIKALADYVYKFAGAVTVWYCQQQNAETLSAISDAAALGARAKTDEDRYAVAQAWQVALSKPRISPS